MKRIGIDARFYGIHFGIGRYLRNLITELQMLDRDNEYYIFLLKDDFNKTTFQKNFHKVLADFSWYGFEEQRKLPKLLNQYKLDLVHFPHFNIPIFYRGNFVVTIHDLIHLKFKMKRASTRNRLFYEVKHQVHKQVINQALRKSQRIITPSEFVKDQLIKGWKVEDKKIIVTPESVEDIFLKPVSDTKAKAVLAKFQVNPPFVYYIGAAHPHKNVEGLIKAFLKLRQNYQYLQLVLAGDDNYFWKRLQKEYHHPSIIYTGFISDEQSQALLQSATVYVQPSFEEGFGIPLLEAFASGTAVVSSKMASLPEVGGDAAIYFDPKVTDDMAEKIKEVLNNQKLRTELIKKGKVRVKQFSWKKMAEQTLSVYKGSV